MPGGSDSARDALAAPKPPSDPATEQLTALATALTDGQQWLLPSSGERDLATDAIVGRFTEPATSLAQGDTCALVPPWAPEVRPVAKEDP